MYIPKEFRLKHFVLGCNINVLAANVLIKFPIVLNK